MFHRKELEAEQAPLSALELYFTTGTPKMKPQEEGSQDDLNSIRFSGPSCKADSDSDYTDGNEDSPMQSPCSSCPTVGEYDVDWQNVGTTSNSIFDFCRRNYRASETKPEDLFGSCQQSTPER